MSHMISHLRVSGTIRSCESDTCQVHSSKNDRNDSLFGAQIQIEIRSCPCRLLDQICIDKNLDQVRLDSRFQAGAQTSRSQPEPTIGSQKVESASRLQKSDRGCVVSQIHAQLCQRPLRCTISMAQDFVEASTVPSAVPGLRALAKLIAYTY